MSTPGKSAGEDKIEALVKILDLEKEKGYRDSAVIGGLDRYLEVNVKKEGSQEILGEICGPDFSYAGLSVDERRAWVEKARLLLAGEASLGRCVQKRTVPERPLRDEYEAAHGRGTPSSSAGRSGKKSARRTVPGAKPEPSSAISLDAPIGTLRGVGPAAEAKFKKLGVETVRDMLYFFPRRHIDYASKRCVADLRVGADQTLIGAVWEARQKFFGGRPGTEAIVGDDTGNIRVVWFNRPYLAKQLKTNSQIVLSGRVDLFNGRKVFVSPEWERLESEDLAHTGRLVPVYPLTEGLSPRMARFVIKQTLARAAPALKDFLPQQMKARHSLMDLAEAVRQAHYPDSLQVKDLSRKRLAFDELFLIQLGVSARKLDWQRTSTAAIFKVDDGLLQTFRENLPFALTGAQDRALEDILGDLGRSSPMCRLLQGDVGSGKTVVATIALLTAAANGWQGALMAPTEVLAEQHFRTLSRIISGLDDSYEEEGILAKFPRLPPYPLVLTMLTGSLGQRQKREIQQLIRQGEVHVVVGTHALIQKDVTFQRLGLAVVDEQHRFGVLQRQALGQKGPTPHVLVMTATPIPRTLALTLYGDLDVSVIDELPAGRVAIQTRCVEPEKREAAYDFVRKKIAEGRQAFIVCPLIEESEVIEARAAVAEFRRLSEEVFPELRLGLLHGRMTAAQKDAVMKNFRDGSIDILVSTPVVEVGIDVPNAVVMLIEGADRFGLSQLHQFRGRVGRGQHKSYCLLLSGTASPEASERLAVIERTRDGFLLAEEDLRLRGPGEFFGTRQSGLPDLRMSRLSDVALLEMAREEALLLLDDDPDLLRPEHKLLGREVGRLWRTGAKGG